MENLTPSEVQKFDQIASEWWNPEGPFKPLHDINPLRIQFILDALDVNSLQHKNVLDVGCGGGILTEGLAKAGANATGIDASSGAIQAASQHAKQSELNIDYVQSTVEQFLTPTPFDIVVCMELLEHVPNPLSVISACARLAKPDGLLFFSTLNRNLKSFLFAIVGAEYVLGLIPKGTHDYAQFIRPSELQKMAKKAGLSITNIQGMTYHPLSKTYALSSNVDVNYLVCCRKSTNHQTH